LKIRTAQVEAFEQVRLPEFEDHMVEHMREFSPLHSKSLGEEGMRVLIRTGMERAKKHGFTQRNTVGFYLETNILLGIDFDTDPQYPWAGQILRAATTPDQTQRADRLHARLIEMLDVAGGPERQFAREALHRARKIPFQATPVGSSQFEQEAIRSMRSTHPEKADYVGEEAMRGLIPRAIEEARKHAVATDAGVCLFLGLMFAVGHGFTGDPKYPWVAGTLANGAITDPDKRVERLYSKTMTYLDKVLEHLEGQQ
jgi:hypothetical protein